MHSALARRLAYGASGSATPLALVLDDDAEDVEVDLATGRWYRIAVPSAGRLASRSAECPAVWAAYRPGATGDRPTRLPYTRLSTITETFFPSAGEYLIRIDAFSDCDGLRFATEWTGGVTFAGAPPKDAPLERNGASVSTVQLNAGQSAWFTLTLTGQEIVTVSTTRLRPGSDTVVEVYRRGETRPVVADDDNGPGEGASRASLMALAPGAYVVRVGDLHGGKGAFDVTFEAVAVTRAQPGSRAGAVPEEGSVWLTLRGRAGRSYRLFTSELGPDVDTVVSVYRRSDGEMVAENDDGSERDLASDLTWEVTEDGEYLVEISGEMGRPGRFRYTIEEAAIPVARCTQPQEAERAVDAASFDGAVAPSGQSDLVLVEFGADWCAACRRLQPLLRRIAAEYCDHVRLVTVNVDEQSELAARFEVDGIPVVLLYADGRLVDRFSGVPSAAELRAFIRQNLPPAERRVST
jgi:thiol-disulfide isomerase/thioredoxin